MGSGSTTSISDFGQPDEHRRQLGHRLRSGLHPDALAGLARVVQLELELLGDDLLGQGHRAGRLRRRRAGLGGGRIPGGLALQEVERHGGPPGGASGCGAMVAGALVPSAVVCHEDEPLVAAQSDRSRVVGRSRAGHVRVPTTGRHRRRPPVGAARVGRHRARTRSRPATSAAPSTPNRRYAEHVRIGRAEEPQPSVLERRPATVARRGGAGSRPGRSRGRSPARRRCGSRRPVRPAATAAPVVNPAPGRRSRASGSGSASDPTTGSRA